MNFFAIFAALLTLPSVLHSAPGSHFCEFQRDDYQMLEGLLSQGGSIEAFISKFADCYFEPRNPLDLILAALQSSLLRERMDLYQFLIERTRLDEAMTDGFFSHLLLLAFGNNKMVFFQQLWYQDFEFKDVGSFYLNLSEQNLEEVKKLISSYTRRAAELIPDNSSICLIDAESALRAIDIAYHCSLTSEAAAAKFNPTGLLTFILHHYGFSDMEMLRVTGRLCDIGAVVRPETFEGIDARDSKDELPRTREALENIQAFQDTVKEPVTD
jgi:hypothetical protein